MARHTRNGRRVKKIKKFSVHWLDPDPSKGSELQKVRPCIVISPDEMNDLLQTVLVIPLTPTTTGWPFRVQVDSMGRESSAACDQLRVIDKSRLKDHIGDLTSTQQKTLTGVLRTIITG